VPFCRLQERESACAGVDLGEVIYRYNEAAADLPGGIIALSSGRPASRSPLVAALSRPYACQDQSRDPRRAAAVGAAPGLGPARSPATTAVVRPPQLLLELLPPMQTKSGDDIKRKHSAAIDSLRGRCRS
jgi:hypothetical protein